MPRIRKKTSKRISTHQRAKFKHKVAEGRKKKKKEAKKNPQWKSKKKKDPGIPNNFPYKDQILAEVAETRRQAEEAKQRRKEEKKAAQEDMVIEEDLVIEEGLVTGNAVHDDAAPLLLNPDLPDLKAVLQKADVVLHVLDARDPASYRLPHIEELASAKEKTELVFVLNKIDLVPREVLTAWVNHLRKQHTTFLFHSASSFFPKSIFNDPKAKGKAKESVDDAVGADTLLEYLGQCAGRLESETLQVAIVGLTNTGKSAIVNSLARKAVVPVYAPSSSTDAWRTTTTRAFEVPVEAAGHKINLVDTPGVSFETEQDPDEKRKTRDMVLRSRGRVDKVKDPAPALEHIVSRADTRDLMVHYNLPAFAPGDCSAFLAGIARSSGHLKKGGQADLTQAARTVLRDWTTGKLPFYTDAPKEDGAAAGLVGAGADGDGVLTELYVRGDGVALGELKTRREMRKVGGLVRVERGEAEGRRVALDAPFVVEEGETESWQDGVGKEDDEDEDENEAEDDDEDDDDGEDEEEEDEDEGEDEDDNLEGGEDGDQSGDDLPAPLLTGKRKRKKEAAAASAAPPTKKVAFAAGTQDRKERQQARAASKLAMKALPKFANNPSSKSANNPSSKSANKPPSKSASNPSKSKPPPQKAAPQKAKVAADADATARAKTKTKTKTGGASAAAPRKETTTTTDTYDFDQFFKS